MPTNYNIAFVDVDGESWSALIEDTTAGEPTTVALKGAGPSPVSIKSINNAEDKTTAIRAKECVMQFVSGEVTLETFAVAEDDRWRVTVTKGGNVVFKGFLAYDDLTEPLRTPVRVITLVATDQLGVLKEKRITDFTGNAFSGMQPLITLLAYALAGTGLQLPIHIASTCKIKRLEELLPFFDAAYVDANMFDAISAESRKCYDVLDALLKNKFYLTQEQGAWWVIDLNDLTGAAVPVRSYSYAGVYTGSGTLDLTHNLPVLYTGSRAKLVRPAKYVSVDFDYRYTSPLVNGELRFGAQREDMDIKGDAPSPDGFSRTHKDFTASGWQLFQINLTTGSVVPPIPTAATSFIRRSYIRGTEIGKFLAINQYNSNVAFTDYMLENANKLLVKAGNIIEMAFDVRYVNGFVGDTAPFCCQLLLHASNGTIYTLNEDKAWQTTTNAITNGKYLRGPLPEFKADYVTYIFNNSTERFSIKSNPLPANGVLIVRLVNLVTKRVSNNTVILQPQAIPRTVYYSNISIKIIPDEGFLTDSVTWRYKAERAGLYSNMTEYNTAIDTCLAVTDGRLLVTDDNPNNLFGYDMPEGFESGGKEFVDYGAVLTHGLWNLGNRVFRTVDASAKVQPDMRCLYRFPDLPGKQFCLLGYDYDARTNTSNRMQFAEVYDAEAGKEDKDIVKDIRLT